MVVEGIKKQKKEIEVIEIDKLYNPTRGYVSFSEAVEEIINYMREKPAKFYDIIVGCDSSSEDDPIFPVVIAVLRTGEGGRFFLKKVRYPRSENKKFANWKNRILQEVLISCNFALSLKEILKEKIKPFEKGLNYQFRYIHADIGEKGRTKDMVKELTNLIRGNGFEPKIKPESCIASNLADRYS